MYHIITRLLVHHVAHHATRHVATHVAQAIQPMPQNTGPNMANVLRAMNQRGQILNSVNEQFQTNLSGEEADATYQNALEAD